MRNYLAAFQWMAFMIAGSIAAPIAIADLFQLSPDQTAGFIQRTIFILGIAAIIQGVIGHRLPINEGPAGLWWGVFAIYAGFSGTLYDSSGEILTILQGGMIFSGIFFFMFAITGWLTKLTKLFTPTVTFVYLLLLILQLSGSFIKGMFGITKDQPTIDPLVLLGSLFTFSIALYFSNHNIQWIKRYSIIIALIIGWLTFIFIGKTVSIQDYDTHFISLPELFAFGKPTFDIGMIVTSFFITLLLITNMIASIRVMEEVKIQNNEEPKKRYSMAGIASGFNQLLGGFFSAIGSVPISGAAGFVSATRIYALFPFILGSVFVLVISLFPSLMSIMATLPAPVGYAVTYVIFINMVGLALVEFKKERKQDRAMFVSGVSLIAGVGAMFVPSNAFVNTPVVVASILNNGLILGTIVAIVTEQFLLWKNNREITTQENT